ncbi:hypothetical protein HY085_00125 [Candidatus Gottesmanbacteria bacterium]|nr:hypothetical protein [Candidatus Gottesmanbacteria bacterium]
MKRLQQEQIAKHERFSGWAIIFLFIAVVILSGSKVFVANRLVGASEKLRKLDWEENRLQNENQILSEEVRISQSTNTIEIKAQNLGFVKNNRFTYLLPAPKIALR